MKIRAYMHIVSFKRFDKQREIWNFNFSFVDIDKIFSKALKILRLVNQNIIILIFLIKGYLQHGLLWMSLSLSLSLSLVIRPYLSLLFVSPPDDLEFTKNPIALNVCLCLCLSLSLSLSLSRYPSLSIIALHKSSRRSSVHKKTDCFEISLSLSLSLSVPIDHCSS